MHDRSDKYRAFYAQLICAAAKATDPVSSRPFATYGANPSPGPGRGRSH